MGRVNPPEKGVKGGNKTRYAGSVTETLVKKEDHAFLRNYKLIVYTTRLEDMEIFRVTPKKYTPADFIESVLSESKPKFRGIVKTPKIQRVFAFADQEMFKHRMREIIHKKSYVELDKVHNVKTLSHHPVVTIDLIAEDTNNVSIPRESQFNVLLQNQVSSISPSSSLSFLDEYIKNIGPNRAGLENRKNCTILSNSRKKGVVNYLCNNEVVSFLISKPGDSLRKENVSLHTKTKILNKFDTNQSNNIDLWSADSSVVVYECSNKKEIIIFWEYNNHTYCFHRLTNCTNYYNALYKYTKIYPFHKKKTFCCWYNENGFLKQYFPQINSRAETFLKSSHECDPYNCACCCKILFYSDVGKGLANESNVSHPILRAALHNCVDLENEILFTIVDMKKKLKVKPSDILTNVPQNTVVHKAINFKVRRTYTFSNLISRSKHGTGPSSIVKIKHERTLTTEYYKIGIKGDVLAQYEFTYSENNVGCNALQNDLNCKTDFTQSVCCWFKRDKFISELKNTMTLSPAALRFMKKRHLCTSICKCCCRPKQTYQRVPRLYLQAQQHVFKEMKDTNDCLKRLTDRGYVSSTIEKVCDTVIDYSMTEIGQAFAKKNTSDSPEVNHLIHTIFERLKNVRLKIGENGRVAACLDRPASALSTDELNVIFNVLHFAQSCLNEEGIMPNTTVNIAAPVNDNVDTSIDNVIENLCEISPTLPSVSKETIESDQSANNDTVIENVSDEDTVVKAPANKIEEISNVICSLEKVNKAALSSFFSAQRIKCQTLQHSYVNSMKPSSVCTQIDPVLNKKLYDKLLCDKKLKRPTDHEKAKTKANFKSTPKAMKRKGEDDVVFFSNKCPIKKMSQDLTDDRDMKLLKNSFDLPSTSKCNISFPIYK